MYVKDKSARLPRLGASFLRALLLGLLLIVASCSSSDPENSENGDAPTTAASAAEDPSGPVEQSAAVSVSGDRLEPMPQGLQITRSSADDPVIGTTAPTLSGTAFDGSETVIGPDGRNKVVMFLAHWCPHCQAEVQLVTELMADGQLPDGLDLYAVTIAVSEERDNYPPSEWLAREGFSGLILRDSPNSNAADAVGVGGIPYVLYLDGDNSVVARSTGSLDRETILELWLETTAA